MEIKVQEVAPAPKVEVKPKPVLKKSKDPINEIESYFVFKTDFDGTAKGFYNVIKDQQHKNFFTISSISKTSSKIAPGSLP